MSYLLRMFSTIEAIILIIMAVVFYMALQSGDLIAIVLSLAMTTLMVAYSTHRRRTADLSS